MINKMKEGFFKNMKPVLYNAGSHEFKLINNKRILMKI